MYIQKVTTEKELEQTLELRKQVFCEEQGVPEKEDSLVTLAVLVVKAAEALSSCHEAHTTALQHSNNKCCSLFK